MKKVNGFYKTTGYEWIVRVVAQVDEQTYQCTIIDSHGMDTQREGTMGMWFECDLMTIKEGE